MKYRGFEYRAEKMNDKIWALWVKNERANCIVGYFKDRKSAYAQAREYIDVYRAGEPTWDKVFAKLPPMAGEESWEIPAQVQKVIEEAKEFLEAGSVGDKRMELGDVAHSVIKLLNMLGADAVDKLLNPVVEKNRARGYYEEVQV